MKKITTVKTQELIDLTKYFGALVGFFALLFASIQWIDSRFVDQRIFEVFQEQRDSQRSADAERLVQLFEALEKERERDLIAIYRAIRDAGMSGLVVRRDILISRGRDNLTDQEKAELEILELRLRDLSSDSL
jgi:hypothetical protein